MRGARENQLADRRRALQLKAASQRAQLVRTAADLHHRMSRLDTGIALLQRVRAKPLVIGAGVAALAFLGPRKLLGWATRGAFIASATSKLLRRLR